MTPCIHRGDIWTHLPNKLCGLKGTMEPIYRCRLHVICTHRKYRHCQTEQCCLACDDYLEHDPKQGDSAFSAQPEPVKYEPNESPQA